MAKAKQLEKEYAKSLYVNDKLTQKDIASRLNVTEKTIGKWVKEGDWDKLRVSMLTTRETQLAALYKQLEMHNNEIATRPIVRDIPAHLTKPIKLKDADGSETLHYPQYDPEDYPIKVGNTPTSKDADITTKITNAIKKLETETSIGDTVEVAKQIIEFIRPVDFEFAKQLTTYFDAFITSKMK